MFSKKNDGSQDADLHTLIAQSTTLHGNLAAEGFVKMDGAIIGNINLNGTLTVGESGHVTGDIHCTELVLFGKVEGNIFAQALHLKPCARVLGDIDTKTLQIEPGANYQGTVKMREFD